jgi:hypothetical protein
MTSQAYFVQPPRIAVWLVKLFTPPEETESILGDLLEEYSCLASKSGVAFARSWYWRQTVKTIARFAGAGFRVAPWSTLVAVAGGFLLLKFGFRLQVRATFAVLERYSVFEHHFNAYVFFASYGLDIGRVILSMFVGCIVALAAKEREMVATTTLSLVLAAMVAAALWVTRGHASFLWMQLPWHCASSIAIVLGGVVVRTHRSAATTRPSGA